MGGEWEVVSEVELSGLRVLVGRLTRWAGLLVVGFFGVKFSGGCSVGCDVEGGLW